MDTVLSPQTPLIPFSAFKTLNLAKEIFLKPFLSCPLEAPKLLHQLRMNTSTEAWQAHGQISNLSVFLNSPHELQTGKPVNFPSRSPWWSCCSPVKLVSALKGVLAGLTPRICQLPSLSGDHREYQAGHLSVSNYRKYHLPFVQGV